MKYPAFLFYPGDWFKDSALRSVSHAAKGVWMDMICLMYECEERGVLISNGRAWSIQDVIKAVGGDARSVRACVQELINKGVAKKRADGAIYSKRMVLDEAIRVDARDRKQKERNGGRIQSQLSHSEVTQLSHSEVTPIVTAKSQTLSVSVSGTVQREGRHARDECDGEGAPTGNSPPPAAPDLAAIPTVEEVVKVGSVQLIPDSYCRYYHEQCTIKHRWMSRDRVILWRRELVSWWRRDEYTWVKRGVQRPSWVIEAELKDTPELESARRQTLLAELETARQRERNNPK